MLNYVTEKTFYSNRKLQQKLSYKVDKKYDVLNEKIYIEKIKENKIIIETNINEIKNEENIIYKAYEKLKSKYNQITGIKVKLNKRIPIQAGMAGGSTDCASFLISMNKLFKLEMSQSKIEEIGKELGADVIPCLYDGTTLVEGIGEKVTKLETKVKYYKPKSMYTISTECQKRWARKARGVMN